MAALARHLVMLCYDLAQHGGALLPALGALRRVAAYWPHVLQPQFADLAHLAGVTSEWAMCFRFGI